MDIKIELKTFYTDGDERRFFDGLKEIKSIKSIRGNGTGLVLSIDINRMSYRMFHELVALLRRYNIPIQPLAVVSETKKLAWIKDPELFWHKDLFQ